MHATTDTAAHAAPAPTGASSPRYFTIEQAAHARPAFTPAALRDLKFRAFDRRNSRGETIIGNGSGAAGVWLQIGRKVLVDIAAFDAWVEGHRK